MRLKEFNVNIAAKHLGQMIGNSMSVNVLERVFCRLLPAAKLSLQLDDPWVTRSGMDRLVADENEAQKDAYEKYVKSPEGMAALNAYKDEVKIAKGGVKRAPETEGESPMAKQARKAKAGA